MQLPEDLGIPLLGNYWGKKMKTYVHTNLKYEVYSMIIYNSQKGGNKSMSISKQVNKNQMYMYTMYKEMKC